MTTKLLTDGEVALMLQASKRSVHRWRDNGTLPPALKLGTHLIRWRKSDIEAFIDSGCVPWRKAQGRGR